MKAIVIATKEEVDLMSVHVHHSDGTKENYYETSTYPFTRYNKDEVEFIKDIDTDNPWTEITQENCNELYELDVENYPIMIAHKWDDNYITYHDLYNVSLSIGTMAKYGGYYYMVLPKLR